MYSGLLHFLVYPPAAAADAAHVPYFCFGSRKNNPRSASWRTISRRLTKRLSRHAVDADRLPAATSHRVLRAHVVHVMAETPCLIIAFLSPATTPPPGRTRACRLHELTSPRARLLILSICMYIRVRDRCRAAIDNRSLRVLGRTIDLLRFLGAYVYGCVSFFELFAKPRFAYGWAIFGTPQRHVYRTRVVESKWNVETLQKRTEPGTAVFFRPAKIDTTRYLSIIFNHGRWVVRRNFSR